MQLGRRLSDALRAIARNFDGLYMGLSCWKVKMFRAIAAARVGGVVVHADGGVLLCCAEPTAGARL